MRFFSGLIFFLLNYFYAFSQEEIRFEWSKNLAPKDYAAAVDLEVDKNGDIFALVDVSEQWQFKGLPKFSSSFFNSSSSLLIKISSSGKPLWYQSFSSAGGVHGRKLTITASNTILVTGFTRGTLSTKDGKMFSASANLRDSREPILGGGAWIAEISNEGKVTWLNGVQGFAVGKSAVKRKDGKTWWSLEYQQAISQDGIFIDSTGFKSSDLYKRSIVLLDEQGVVIDKHPFSYTGSQEGVYVHGELRLDSEENLIVYGNYVKHHKIEYQTPFKEINDQEYAGIFKFNQQQEMIFSKFLFGEGSQSIQDLKVDEMDNISFIGTFSSSCLLSSPMVSSRRIQQIEGKSNDNAFYGSLDPYGNPIHLLFFRQPDSHQQVYFRDMAIDQNGNCHIVGYFRKFLNFSSINPKLTPLEGNIHQISGFHSVWNQDSILSISNPFPDNLGFTHPFSVACSSSTFAVLGEFANQKPMTFKGVKESKLQSRKSGRSLYLYSGVVPKVIQYSKPSFELLQDSVLVQTEGALNSENTEIDDILIDEIEDPKIEIFPNPTSDISRVRVINCSVHLEVRVYNAQGNLLHVSNEFSESGNHDFVLDFNQYAKGTYFIHLNCGSKRLAESIIRI